MTEFSQAVPRTHRNLYVAQRAVNRAIRWTHEIRYSGGAYNDVRNGALAKAADRELDTADRTIRMAPQHELKAVDGQNIRLEARVRGYLGSAAVALQPELGVPRVLTLDGRIGRAIEARNIRTGGDWHKRGRPRDAYGMVRSVMGRAGFSRAYRRYETRHRRPPTYDDLVREIKGYGHFLWQVTEGFQRSYGGKYNALVREAKETDPSRHKHPPRVSLELSKPTSQDGSQRAHMNRGRLVRGITAVLSPSERPPLVWGGVSDVYGEMYPLRHQVYESLDDERRTAIAASLDGPAPEGIPPALWGRYYAPDVAGPKGPELSKAIIRLAGIPKVTAAQAAALEAEYRPDRPFLCFMDDRLTRTGNPDFDPVRLGGWDVALLNLLIIGELRSGRAVGKERMLVHSGLSGERFDRFFSGLIQKLRGPASPGTRPMAADTIIRTSGGGKSGNPHYRINPHALVIDARTSKQEGK